MRRWFLVRTKPSAEALAAAQLARQGYETYLPRLTRPVRRAGRWVQRVGALFPGYLFLLLDEGRQALAPVRSTVGVASVVRFGTRYAVVPEGVVHELRERADPATGLHRLNAGRRLTAGAAVRIAGGAFDGIDGIFERAIGTDRVIVLLGILGQYARVQLPADLVCGQVA